MKLDWEGIVSGLYVHATYSLDWDEYGRSQAVVIDSLKAFDDEKEVDVPDDFSDTVAEVIEDEATCR